MTSTPGENYSEAHNYVRQYVTVGNAAPQVLTIAQIYAWLAVVDELRTITELLRKATQDQRE